MMYLQALGLKSDLPDVHYGLATVYFQLRELTSAAHHFKEVTRLDPQRVGAYVNLGAVMNLLDQLDEAIVALRRSIQLDAKRVEGYYNLGLVYRRKGQIDLAIQAYREAIRLNPRMSDAHLNLANLLFEKEQYRLGGNQLPKGAGIAARLGEGHRRPGGGAGGGRPGRKTKARPTSPSDRAAESSRAAATLSTRRSIRPSTPPC